MTFDEKESTILSALRECEAILKLVLNQPGDWRPLGINFWLKGDTDGAGC